METGNHSLTRRNIINNGCSSSSFRLRCPSLNSLRLRRIFDLFDKNSDGTITVHELSQALNLLGLHTDISDLDSMVKSHTQPGNTGLKFEDFESLHTSLNDTFFGMDDDEEEEQEKLKEVQCYSAISKAKKSKEWQEESDLSEAFKVFDEDGDGYISARELQAVLGKLGFPQGREIDRVERMISSVDRNQDGLVDFFEFKDMMRSVIVRTS